MSATDANVADRHRHSTKMMKLKMFEAEPPTKPNYFPANGVNLARVPLSTLGGINTVNTLTLPELRFSKCRPGKPRTIVVEGNIGSGKSTLLKYFGQKDDIEIFPEPVDKWRDNKGQNMLDLMYQDASRWSFAFQSYAQFTMLEVHQAASNRRIKLMERSIHSGKYCFIENLYQSEKLAESEYNILSAWFDWLLTTDDLHIDLIVYLRTTPELCQRRINSRSRFEETCIPIDYLQDLHNLHEDWLIKKNKFQLPAPVLVLDASKPLAEMTAQFQQLEDKLQ